MLHELEIVGIKNEKDICMTLPEPFRGAFAGPAPTSASRLEAQTIAAAEGVPRFHSKV